MKKEVTMKNNSKLFYLIFGIIASLNSFGAMLKTSSIKHLNNIFNKENNRTLKEILHKHNINTKTKKVNEMTLGTQDLRN
jgi:hypothetical protein